MSLLDKIKGLFGKQRETDIDKFDIAEINEELKEFKENIDQMEKHKRDDIIKTSNEIQMQIEREELEAEEALASDHKERLRKLEQMKQQFSEVGDRNSHQ